jgi:ribosome-associated heat shock protein Hsp15
MTNKGAIEAAVAVTARLDVWLWHARVLSTRSACARLVSERGVRINGHMTEKPGARVRPGDVMTLAVGQRVRVLRVVGIAERRESAARAALLYEDLVPRS